MGKFVYYARLYRLFLVINLKATLIYDKDALLDIMAMFLKSVFNLAVFFFIFDLVPNLDNWDVEEVLLIYSLSSLAFAIWRCFYINTLSISYYLATGELDRFLKRPIHIIFSIMTDGFDEDAWGDLLFSLIIFMVSIALNNISLFWVIPLLITTLFSSIIFGSITLLFSTISFFTISGYNLSEVVYSIQEFSKYPLSIFSKVIQIIFTYLLPIACIASLPSQIALENNFSLLWKFPAYWGVAIFFFYIVTKIWNCALLRYQSSGT